jgi:hypothetical protein
MTQAMLITLVCYAGVTVVRFAFRAYRGAPLLTKEPL